MFRFQKIKPTAIQYLNFPIEIFKEYYAQRMRLRLEYKNKQMVETKKRKGEKGKKSQKDHGQQF